MYPGVPLVSHELSGLQIRAIPRSVRRRYPSLSNTRFSGLISRWIIEFLCRYSRLNRIQAIKNSKK